MLPSARDLLVVDVDRLPSEGPNVGGHDRDDEVDDHKRKGKGAIDAWQKSFAEGEVEGRRKDEGRRDDEDSVEAMPGGRFVAGGHSPEVEREGGGEAEQDERQGGRALPLEAVDTREDRREDSLYHE